MRDEGRIRIGSGHNFGIPSGMNKIMGTATVQRQGIFNYPLPLPIGFATIEACVSATTHIPHFDSKVQLMLNVILYYDIIYVLQQI